MSHRVGNMAPNDFNNDETRRIRVRLKNLDAERQALVARLSEIGRQDQPDAKNAQLIMSVTNRSPGIEKITLFRSLFRGREDVYPRRWENARTGRVGYAPVCANEWKPKLCGKPALKCGACPNQSFVPVSDEAIESHLRGRETLGVYPMLSDGDCWFLVADFDKETWQADAGAFLAASQSRQAPAALERSRSGNGGHVWIFFSEPVSSALARQLGSHLLTVALESNPDIGFDSYDRFFPSQDTLPEGGFGNLIALPLQAGPRDNGNSVFLDDNFEPHADQWAFLSSLHRMTPAEVSEIVDAASRQGRVMGLRLPLEQEDLEPWTAPPTGRKYEPTITGELPDQIAVVLADQLYIPRTGLPSGLVNRIVRLAAFQNPEFYRAQAMRRSTFGIPRVIACAELQSHHVVLPRGCREPLRQLFEELGINLQLTDKRNSGQQISIDFLGTLAKEQQCAADTLSEHETGVLAAATGFGKTVVAAAMIAERGVNTLVLVHRRQLMDQWVMQLGAFLDLQHATVGRVGGGKRNPGGVIDVAMLQSLVRGNVVADLVADYGHLIVDECHHLSAVSFEAVSRKARAKFVLGLSATVTRRDGHHPIVFMQCGPVRYKTSAKSEALRRPFQHTALVRPTSFRLPAGMEENLPSIQQIYAALIEDEDRNTLIFNDVLAVLKEGRSPIILTERRDHARQLAGKLEGVVDNVLLFHGGMGAKRRNEFMKRLEEVPNEEERVLIATGRYVGEGFDDARLDTLFLAMPVSWKGTLTQYVGRLHRLHPGKREVRVHDYLDEAVPMLNRMGAKRIKAYQSLGYTVK